MDSKERSEKDIKKLESLIAKVKDKSLHEKYPEIFHYALHYLHDARHYHEKGDYFTSFGCANYSYGLLESLIFQVEGLPK